MRIHKFLSRAGVTSRRRAEQLIKDGLVSVNENPGRIGQIIDENNDCIKVSGKTIHLPATSVTYLVNKPRFVVSTVSDPQGRKTVVDLVPHTAHLYPVGRLDYESEGLMLLTSDGDLAYTLTHPKFAVPKTYRVQVKGKLNHKIRARLEKGLIIDGRRTAPAVVEPGETTPDRTWFDITIHEGRNRQIRKMCAAVNLAVTRLIRTKLGDHELGNLKPGEYRLLA